MKNKKLIVKTKSKTYPIYFGYNILNITGKLIKKNLSDVKKICIISDNKLPQVLLKKLVNSLKRYNLKIYKLPVSEKTKTLNVANKIIGQLLQDNFNRSDCIIALGGGVLGDLAAFVSSLVKRGIKFINIPTTLLAQVDASIGGKTAVNSIQGKNLIGTFYQPDFVLMDISFLNSLTRREMICGYGEMLKHSIILNKNFFLWLTKKAKKIINDKNKNLLKISILQNCKIKAKIVSKDEREKNLRKILNFGHTFAHGFEATKNFSKSLNHGEAVLLGIIIASELSYKRKLLPFKDLMLIKKHYLDLNLPMEINKFFKKKEVGKIVNFMKKDKKNLDEKINLVLIKKIGKATTLDTSINADKLKKFLIENFI